jgi:hypothetical protein
VSFKGLDRLKELQARGEWPPKTPDEAKAILDEMKSAKPVAAGGAKKEAADLSS